MPKPNKAAPGAAVAPAPLPGILARFVQMEPATYSEADNSVEAVFTTGAAVHRVDPWTGDEFDEVLVVEPGAVRLDRLNAGAPVLDTHGAARGLEAVVGSVVPSSATVAGGVGRCRIRLASTPDVADVVAKVREGIIRNISVGYLIHRSELREVGDGRRPQLVAIEWEPVEVSLVAIPADPGAQLRQLSPLNAPATAMLPPIAPGQERAAADYGRADRAISAARLRDLLTSGAGVPADRVADILVRHATSPLSEAEGFEIMNRFIADRPGTNSRVQVLVDEGQTARTGLEDALYSRMAGIRPNGPGEAFRGLSMMGMAREWLGHTGRLDRLTSDAEVLERSMHTGSDFPRIVSSAGNRFMLDNYMAAESAIKRVSRVREVPDFRPVSVIGLATRGPIDIVAEGGEVKYGSVGDSGEVYQLATWAQIVGISRQVIINDDLGAFSNPLALYGRATAEVEASRLAAILNANSGAGVNMADGNPLHNVQWGNRAATGSAISVASLGEARAALRGMRDLNGDPNVPSNVVPRTLLVPAALETVAEQFVAQLTPSAPANANPFAGQLTVEVDPRLSGTGWRLFGDPALFPVLEVAYLQGAVGPRLDIREGFNVLGIEFRVVLDFAAAAVSRVGSYWNPGA